MVDFTYVENVVHGHILAAERMTRQSSICGKVCLSCSIHDIMYFSPQAYNVTNDDPLPFWDFISQLLTGLGYSPPSFHLPYWLLYFLSCLLHWLVILLSPITTITPTFTPMRVALAGTHHYYSCQQAQKDLGYSPPVPLQEGVKRTLHAFSHLQK